MAVLLFEQGMISLKELTMNRTKIEAKGNRYTFAWGNAIEVSRERTARQVKEM